MRVSVGWVGGCGGRGGYGWVHVRVGMRVSVGWVGVGMGGCMWVCV